MWKIKGFFLISFASSLIFTVTSSDEDDFKNDICTNHSSKNSFTLADYLVVGVMLLVSCIIGTFYGFFGKKQKTSDDFLLGGSNMGTIPMSLSLAAR